MKTTFFTLLGFMLSSCQQQPTHNAMNTIAAKQVKAEPVNQSNISKVYHSYLELKDALVKSDGAGARVAASTLTNNLLAIKGCDEAAVLSRQISNTNDIKAQRLNFALLTSDVISLVKGAKLPGVAYVDYCPMANKGKGAYWLSATKNIDNPYLDDMKECGEIKQEIK